MSLTNRLWVWSLAVGMVACGNDGGGIVESTAEDAAAEEAGVEDDDTGETDVPGPSEEDASVVPVEPTMPGTGSVDTVEELALLLVEEGLIDLVSASDDWTVEITATPLTADERVVPQNGESRFEPEGDYWFAFVNRDTLGLYEHPVDFVFVDVATGDVTIEEQSWWPVMGDGGDFVTLDRPLVRIFPHGEPEAEAAPPSAANEGAPRRALWLFYPDYEGNTLDARLLVLAQEGDGYLNFAADLDQSGSYENAPGAPEWLVENHAVPATGLDWVPPDPDDPDAGEVATAWLLTDAFAMPLDENNKFPVTLWTRVAASEAPITATDADAGWDGECDDCGDVYFDFRAWADPGVDEVVSAMGGSAMPTNTPGPAVDWSFMLDLFSMGLQKAPCSYVCAPGNQTIETSCKALVINLGDRPGETMMAVEAASTVQLFKRRFNDDAVAVLNVPTAAKALEDIRSFVQGIQCLDEAQLYIIGHGARNGAGVHSTNGGGFVSPAALKEAITSAEHCPQMSFGPQSQDCRQPGYCDLSVSIMSCFAGFFTSGDNSIAMPGINTLVAASSMLPSWGRNNEGMFVGQALRRAFENGATNNRVACADAADSYTKTGKVQRQDRRGRPLYLADEMGRPRRDANGRPIPALVDRDLTSNAACTHEADCSCTCSSCGDGVVDQSTGEQCDPPSQMPGAGCPSHAPDCNAECQCVCDLTCPDNYSLDSESCTCECDRECDEGYALDPESCECSCNRQCDAPYVLDTAACSCQCNLQCDAPYVLDPDACSCECNLQCDGGYTLDAAACSCVCELTQEDCDAQGSGLIVDQGTCTCVPHCGNGVAEGALGEECDHGAANDGVSVVDGAICREDCTLAFCGDGYVDAGLGEACDDGLLNGTPNAQGQLCTSECQLAGCGDGVIDEAIGEECDPPEPLPTLEVAAECEMDNAICSDSCTCECSLTQEICDTLNAGVFDPDLCECRDYCGELPETTTLILVMESVFDPNGHRPYAKVLLGPLYDLLFNLQPMASLEQGAERQVTPAFVVNAVSQSAGNWSTPGIPASDIIAMTGTLTTTSAGCSFAGSGSGAFANYGGSQCSFQALVEPTGEVSGTYTCTPAPFPGQPITYNFSGTAQ